MQNDKSKFKIMIKNIPQGYHSFDFCVLNFNFIHVIA